MNRQAEAVMSGSDRDTISLPMPRFADRLQDGERLLWEGRPDARAFLASARTEAAGWSLPLFPMLLLIDCVLSGGRMSWLSLEFWLIPAGISLAGYWAFYGQLAAQASAAAYALTNRRLFIQRMEELTSVDQRPRVDEIPLRSVRPRLRPLRSGEFGTISLGMSWAVVYNTQRVLRAIPNAAAVFALLTEAKAANAEALPAEQPSGPYYAKADRTARAESAWTLSDTLRHGETVLWQGTVNAEAAWRAGWWIIPILATVMAAIGGFVLWGFGVWTWVWQILTFGGSLAIVFPIARRDSLAGSGRPMYVLTNRRVFVVKDAGNRGQEIEERELPELVNTRLKRGKNGFGTIIFEKKTRFIGTGRGGTIETYEFSFEHIADAEAVSILIQAAQAGYSAASA